MEDSQLKAVFDLLDERGKGFVSYSDLVRASKSQDQGIEHVLTLLNLKKQDICDFADFKQRVLGAIGGGSEQRQDDGCRRERHNDVFEGRGETSEECTSTKLVPKTPRRGSASAGCGESRGLHQEGSSPLAADISRSLRRLQRQIEEVKETQTDAREELLAMLDQQFRRRDEEFNRKMGHIQALADERVSSEKKRMEAMMALEEKSFSSKLDKLELEKKSLSQQTLACKEQIEMLQKSLQNKDEDLQRLEKTVARVQGRAERQDQAAEVANAERFVLKESNLQLQERLKVMDERLEIESSSAAQLRIQLEERKDRLDEDRVTLAFEKAQLATEKQELLGEVSSLKEELGVLRKQFESSRRKLGAGPSFSSSPQPGRHSASFLNTSIVSLGLEVFETPMEVLESREDLVAENKKLKVNIRELSVELTSLENELQSVQEERERLREGLKTAQDCKSEQSHRLVNQFKDLLPSFSSNKRAKTRELEKQIREEENLRISLVKKHTEEKDALDILLKRNQKQLTEQQSHYELQIAELKAQLQESLVQVTCLKDVSGLIKLNEGERRVSSILVEDLKSENKCIKHQIDTLQEENVRLKQILTMITDTLNLQNIFLPSDD